MLMCLQVLQKAGLPDAQLMHLSTQVFQLQCAFERMALVKEYRYCTPNFDSSLASACTCCLRFLCGCAVLCSRSFASERWCGSLSLVRLVWQMSVQVTCLIEHLSGWKMLQWLDDQGGMSQQGKRGLQMQFTCQILQRCTVLHRRQPPNQPRTADAPICCLRAAGCCDDTTSFTLVATACHKSMSWRTVCIQDATGHPGAGAVLCCGVHSLVLWALLR